jgi:hypothetical protein
MSRERASPLRIYSSQVLAVTERAYCGRVELNNILDAEAAETSDDDIEAVRRTSFNGFVPSRAHIELYSQPMRSFTGYKVTPRQIELYRQQTLSAKQYTQEI